MLLYTVNFTILPLGGAFHRAARARQLADASVYYIRVRYSLIYICMSSRRGYMAPTNPFIYFTAPSLYVHVYNGYEPPRYPTRRLRWLLKRTKSLEFIVTVITWTRGGAFRTRRPNDLARDPLKQYNFFY